MPTIVDIPGLQTVFYNRSGLSVIQVTCSGAPLPHSPISPTLIPYNSGDMWVYADAIVSNTITQTPYGFQVDAGMEVGDTILLLGSSNGVGGSVFDENDVEILSDHRGAHRITKLPLGKYLVDDAGTVKP